MYKDSFFNCEKSNLEIYYCQHCNFKTSIEIFFYQHFQKFHTENKKFLLSSVTIGKCFTCEKCNYSTFSLLLFFKHNLICLEDTEKKKSKYQCFYCPCKGTCNTVLRNHIIKRRIQDQKKNNRIFLYYCDFCKYESKYKANVKRHIIAMHIEKYKCNTCEFSSVNQEVLKRHILKRHCIWYQCDHCTYRSKEKKNLKYHITSHHKSEEEISLFYCNHCEYKAKMERNLKRHILSKHTARENLPKYECNKCKYNTVRKEHLKIHMIRRHTAAEKIQWYQCEQCIYRSKVKSDLRQHIKTHKKPKHGKYECSTCQFKTIYEEALKIHVIQCHSGSGEIESGELAA